jgi:hypothetical protein
MILNNTPNKIYLQVEDDSMEDEVVDFNELSEVTWCTEGINSSDLQYFSVNIIIDFIKWLALNTTRDYVNGKIRFTYHGSIIEEVELFNLFLKDYE